MLTNMIVILSILTIASGITCGENCPSNSCTECWCGITKNIRDIPQLCSQYDWDQDCCKCIMSRQSGGNSNAMSQLGTNPPRGPLTGLWQLNELVRNITCKLANKDQLCSPQTNMECAYKLYQINLRRFDMPWQASAKACGCSTKQLITD